MSHPFIARFSTRCPGGCDGIEPGDEIEYVDDTTVMHTDCENAEGLRGHEREESPDPCPDCWLIHPTGRCDA